MNKKQILAMGMSVAVLCAGTALAVDAGQVNTQNDALSTEAMETQTNMRMSTMATVVSVETGSETDKSILVKTEQGQELQLNLGMQTLIVDNATGVPAAFEEIKAGDKIFVYYSPAMTRSLPPQSACELILVNVGDQVPAALHTVGALNERVETNSEQYAVTDAAGDMVLYINADDKAVVSALKSKNIVTAKDLTEGTRFLAWYDMVFESYPGQAYPEKIVILPPLELTEDADPVIETPDQAPTELSVIADGKTLPSKANMKNGKAVVVVRETAEALGMKVSYMQKDGNEYVVLQNDMRKMTLEIGQDLYVSTPSKESMTGMAAPAQYGVAPYIEDGKTYAPAEFFEAMMGFDVKIENNTVVITAKK